MQVLHSFKGISEEKSDCSYRANSRRKLPMFFEVEDLARGGGWRGEKKIA